MREASQRRGGGALRRPVQQYVLGARRRVFPNAVATKDGERRDPPEQQPPMQHPFRLLPSRGTTARRPGSAPTIPLFAIFAILCGYYLFPYASGPWIEKIETRFRIFFL